MVRSNRSIWHCDKCTMVISFHAQEMWAEYKRGDKNWAEFIVRDKNMISGQNPASSAPMAEAVLAAVK
jgi:putative intracellular protease/amidase